MFWNNATAKAVVSGSALLVATFCFAGAAHAALFSVSVGGTPSALSTNFDPSFLSTPANNPDNIHGTGGSPTGITIFGYGTPGGLKVSGADANTLVTYTYLGTEAAYTNLFMVGATPTLLFQNHDTITPAGTATVGGASSSPFSAGNGFLSFLFRSVDPGSTDAVNGGLINQQVALAVALVGTTRAYLFLEDIAQNGDHDFDDMVVRVDLTERESAPPGPTPIPGAAWLFGGALAGVAGLCGARRRRKSGHA